MCVMQPDAPSPHPPATTPHRTEWSKTRFDQEIARSVAEYEAYLQEYGNLAEAVRAMDIDAG